MRTTLRIVLSVLALGCLAAAEPAAEADRSGPGAAGEADREGYLGIGIRRLDPAAGRVLGLGAGEGLEVTAVDPDGPAASAGLTDGDVLIRLDEQILITPEQLVVLVRNRPGAEVRLRIRRAGSPRELAARVGSRPAVRREDRDDILADLSGRAAEGPERWRRRLPEIEERTWTYEFPDRDFDRNLTREMERVRRMLQRLRRGTRILPPGLAGGLCFEPGSRIVSDDGRHRIELSAGGGGPRARVTDADGSVLHDGPADDGSIADLPPALRRRIRELRGRLREAAGEGDRAPAGEPAVPEDAPLPPETDPNLL